MNENAPRYEGEFVNGKKQGYGKCTFSDGSTFEGNIVENECTGLGIYIWKQFGTKYIGEWLDNFMHGKGVFSWPDGRKYEGDF